MTSIVDVKGIKCQRCGRCCQEAGASLPLTLDDIKHWNIERRNDILDYLFFYEIQSCPCCQQEYPSEKTMCDDCGIQLECETVLLGDIWIDPVTNTELHGCPFLKKKKNAETYECTIYDTRPVICRKFPYQLKDENNSCQYQEERLDEWAINNCPAISTKLTS
jgi:Fe-S-cluster containining protein